MVKEPSYNKIKNVFFLTVAVIFIAFDLSLAFFVISWSTPISIVMYIILSIFLYSFSLKFAEKIFSFFLKPYKLYKLEDGLTTKPKVAILYSTMNDVLPECLSIIKQTYPCDVFVLDDSSLEEKREFVDKIAGVKGFKVLRRSERKGFKAGAINNWINLYGNNYDYFVLLDSDSFIPKDWVEKTLEYAENPINSKIAIFQGLINIWNLDNKFIKTLSALHKVGQDIWELKIANYLNAIYCYGHNVMLRTKSVLEIGGFEEGYVSEDFATAIKLAEHGYKSRFVPLHTYEAMPENIRGFIKRQHKWTRGAMEFLSFIKNSSLTLTQKVLLSSIPIGHFSYVAILTAMILTVFGYATNFNQFYLFLQNLFTYHIFFVWSIPIFRFAIAVSSISLIVNIAKFRKLGITAYQVFRHEILSKAIGTIMMPYEFLSILNYMVSRKLVWPVTPKHENQLSFKDVLFISKITIALSFAFVIGLLFVNPLGFIFNLNWLVPFIFAPITLYLYSNDQVTKSIIYNDGGKYSDSKINSNAAQSTEVYSLLRKGITPIIDFNLPMGYKKLIFTSLIVLLFSLSGLLVYETVTGLFIYQPQVSLPPTIGNLTACGNGICEIGENSTNCPNDCLEIAAPVSLEGGVQLRGASVIGPNKDPKEIYINEIVKFYVYADKISGANISKVWVNVKSPSGSSETIELSNNGVWSGSLKVKESGDYIAVFNAVDESNTYAQQVMIVFTVKIIVPLTPAFFGGSVSLPPTAY